MPEKPNTPKVPEHIRRSLKEQSKTHTKPHPKGTTARPRNDWPPKGVDTGRPPEKTTGKEAAAPTGAETKATDEEAATKPKGK